MKEGNRGKCCTKLSKKTAKEGEIQFPSSNQKCQENEVVMNHTLAQAGCEVMGQTDEPAPRLLPERWSLNWKQQRGDWWALSSAHNVLLAQSISSSVRYSHRRGLILPPLLPLFSITIAGVERQGDPAAPPAASAGTIQGRCQDDPTPAGGGEEPVLGADGHPGGDGSLRLRGAAPEGPSSGDQAPLLHAETRYELYANTQSLYPSFDIHYQISLPQ